MKKRIDQILAEKEYFTTRQKAQYAIENQCVYVEQKMIRKPGKLIEESSQIEIRKESLPFVSRGGFKLEKALEEFFLEIQDKICMDIGASTGGFTDCMLQRGAKKIYAVDVGHDQLAESLKQDTRVINLEGTNIKEMGEEYDEKIDFIATDVSFISLEQVIPKAYCFLKQDGSMIALIKPQFEAGKEAIHKNGVVKDAKTHERVIEKIILLANSIAFQVRGITYSPIKGAAGNIEYLLYLTKENSKPKFDILMNRKIIHKIVRQAHENLKKKE